MAKQERGLRFQPSGGSRAPQVPTGKKQRLTIERLANDGRGIAFIEGRTWFVIGALAGEEVEARVLGAHGKVVEARTERVFLPSELRRAAPCVHAGRCGGCSVQHLPHDEQLALKQRMLAEQLSRVAGVVPEEWAAPLSGPEFGYRRRARVAVRWDQKAKKLEVGFRAVGSQDIVAIGDCPVLVQPLQPIMSRLPEMLRRLSKPQALGHVELFAGSSRAVLLRHMAPLSEADLTILKDFCAFHEAQLWLHGEGEPHARYVGSYYFDAANTGTSDGTTLFDAAFNYKLFKGTDLAVNVSNLLDEQHVVGSGTANYYNPGREVTAKLSYNW